MNPPFSASVHVDRQMADAALRHVGSALARLPRGGRLVTVTGANIAPENPAWTDAFKRLQEQGRVMFSAAIDGAVYAKHGTSIDTRLTVIDRVIEHVPPRRPVAGTATAVAPAIASPPTPRTVRAYLGQRQPAMAPALDLVATEVAYALVDCTPTDASQISDALYEAYTLQSIRIPAQPHPTKLVQSAAMASS
jgi:hypothetical protein